MQNIHALRKLMQECASRMVCPWQNTQMLLYSTMHASISIVIAAVLMYLQFGHL
jgi:hypothetical protein